PQGLVIALVFAAAMNFGSYWFADRFVLAMYGARELSEQDAPDLFRIVRELATGIAMPMPRIYLVPSDSPNAFATGRSPEHAAGASTRLMRPARTSCTARRSSPTRSRRSRACPIVSR